ncbi:MAG: tetratricopeptide repeat protein [Ignavibacteriaceae bacterium]|nr:tetratricopeptide repeat protein [Ignavibacteriaceae bacterium]
MRNIKPIYIYIGGFIFALIIIVIISKTSNVKTNNMSVPPGAGIIDKAMPQDSIHKGLQNPLTQPPDKNNVMAGIKQHMDELKKTAEEHPRDTLKMREYADFLTAAHQNDQAVVYYNKILKVNPGRVDILSSLVFLYFSSNNLNEAELYLNKILAVDKNNVDAIYNLGVVSANKGDRAKAKQLWSKIINNYPSSSLAQKAKESIAQL